MIATILILSFFSGVLFAVFEHLRKRRLRRAANAFHVFEGWEAYTVARTIDEAVELLAIGYDDDERQDVRNDLTQLDDDAFITLCMSEDEREPIRKTCREFIDWQFPEHNGPFFLAQDPY